MAEEETAQEPSELEQVRAEVTELQLLLKANGVGGTINPLDLLCDVRALMHVLVGSGFCSQEQWDLARAVAQRDLARALLEQYRHQQSVQAEVQRVAEEAKAEARRGLIVPPHVARSRHSKGIAALRSVSKTDD